VDRSRIALQMYTLREEAKGDFAGILRRVAELGYEGVELAGYGGLEAPALRALLDELGLVAAASHVRLERLQSALDEELDFAEAIGCRDLVCPSAPEGRRETVDDYRRLAALLDEVGERCRQRGTRFSYHNHAFEFVRLPAAEPASAGTTARALDLLLGWTDPQLVRWEPDVYWIARAGDDPVAYLHAYAGRCPLVHLKDVADDAERSFAPVGAGTLDFGQICDAAQTGGAEWLIVEQDRSVGPAIESVAVSIANLRAWGRV
jgi:sugar phosphate isomerase/epimerase